jgi:hypothetical protein
MRSMKKEVLMHRLSVLLPAELVKRAKLRALQEGASLTKVLEARLTEYVKRPAQGGGKSA